jgi:riboflavin synthase
MFTGLIQSTGEMLESMPRAHGISLCIHPLEASFHPALGASVSVNGVCLTVVDPRPDRLVFDLSPETRRLTTLGALRPGGRVNLESALRVGDELGGHFVSGHVDAVGQVRLRKVQEDCLVFEIEVPPGLERWIAPKGSIAVDGVSLTVNALRGRIFSIMLIPHTIHRTILGQLEVGAAVNLEVDLLARYLDRMREAGPA